MKKNTSAFAKALKLLTRRDHCQYELTQKLAVDYPEDEISEAVARCLQENWLNDVRFAESYIRYRSSSGYGLARITQELKLKGVDAESLSTAVELVEVDWKSVLYRLIERKYSPALTAAELMKLQAYFMRKGFPLDLIRQCLKQLRHPSDS